MPNEPESTPPTTGGSPQPNGQNGEELSLLIKNGALQTLKSLAQKLGVSEDNLLEVVKKSTGVLSTLKELSGSNNFIIVEDEKGRRFKIDL